MNSSFCAHQQGQLDGDNAPHPIEPRWRTSAALLLLAGGSPAALSLAGRSQARGLPSSRCASVRGHTWSRSARIAGRSQAIGLPSSRCPGVRGHTWSRSAQPCQRTPLGRGLLRFPGSIPGAVGNAVPAVIAIPDGAARERYCMYTAPSLINIPPLMVGTSKTWGRRRAAWTSLINISPLMVGTLCAGGRWGQVRGCPERLQACRRLRAMAADASRMVSPSAGSWAARSQNSMAQPRASRASVS